MIPHPPDPADVVDDGDPDDAYAPGDLTLDDLDPAALDRLVAAMAEVDDHDKTDRKSVV